MDWESFKDLVVNKFKEGTILEDTGGGINLIWPWGGDPDGYIDIRLYEDEENIKIWDLPKEGLTGDMIRDMTQPNPRYSYQDYLWKMLRACPGVIPTENVYAIKESVKTDKFWFWIIERCDGTHQILMGETFMKDDKEVPRQLQIMDEGAYLYMKLQLTKYIERWGHSV